MSAQDFEAIRELLPAVESVVLEAHRDLYERSGQRWSRPIAYRWLHYEDPLPVERLREGVEKLVGLNARFVTVAVEKACTEAGQRGFPI